MKTLLNSTSATVLAAIFATAPAFAQTDQGGGQGETGQTMQSGEGRSASEVTCREITMMDTAQVPAVLYYIAGHGSGMEDAGGASSGGSGEMASAGSGGQDGSSGSDMSAADADASDSGSGGSDDAQTTASTDAGGQDASGTSQAGDGARLIQIRGFYEIPVERTVVACGEQPDSRAGDVMREQRESEGS